MTDFTQKQVLHRSSWKGYDATFRVCLEWVLRHTSLDDATKASEVLDGRQKARAAEGLSAIRGAVDTVPGAESITHAFALADFALKELYLRRMRRDPIELPSVMDVFERLSSATGSPDHQAAGQLLGTIMLAEENDQLLCGRPLYEDPASLVRAEIEAWRKLSPAEGVQHLLNIAPHLVNSIQIQWPQNAVDVSQRVKDRLSGIFRLLESELSAYS